MLLTDIPKHINCKKIYNFKKQQIEFTNIYFNSKFINNSSVFAFDIKKKIKKEYIIESVKKGAVALISNQYQKNLLIPQYIVVNVKRNIKILLKKIFPYPPLNSIGITGTNGKTSVVWFISQICKLNKKSIKTYGTLGYYKNGKKVKDSNLTTPEYEILYQNAFLKKKNLFNFAFEVSSHSLYQNRIENFPINIAAITNISHDHLDYHKTYNQYKKTKFKLFLNKLKKNGIAIINDNIKESKILKEKLIYKNRIITYGKKNSHVNILIIKKEVEIKIYTKKYLITLPNYTLIELENLSCAICCCLAINIINKEIIKVLPKIIKPLGRFEEVGRLNNNSKIIVDYAHTPDALKNILISNTFMNYKPNVVFGCGGERDKEKRLLMGSIAEKYANKVYVTDDNPRFENAKQIRLAIISKCKKAVEIADRKKAIKEAIYNLKKNEILIIAGKGHEKKQIKKNKTIFFDDVKIAKYYLMQINESK